VVTDPTEGSIRNGVTEWLQSRNSGGFFGKELFLDFSAEVNMTAPINPAGTGQFRNPHIRGRDKEVTVLKWGRTDLPLFGAGGGFSTWRNWRIQDLGLTSPVALPADELPVAFLLDSSNSGTYANQDGLFHTISFDGAWAAGFKFIGTKTTANLNSEVGFGRPHAKNKASFRDGMFLIGGQPGVLEQNQFLNYHIWDSKCEMSHGIILNVQYGGNVVLDGFNSWMFTGDSNGGVPKGTMILLGPGSKWQAGPILKVYALRPEVRGNEVVMLDSSWGTTGVIYIAPGYDDSAQHYKKSDGTWKVNDMPLWKLRGTARVVLDTITTGGHIETYADARIDLRNVVTIGEAATNSPVSGTPVSGASTKGFVRQVSGNAPKLQYRSWT
jgi:hypothetical protein